ncbi:unnamed protein product [Clavelina lepadiformis]|uniref:Uncharacterized protein n=1 Tax=Clavelina lepadiformis TaxID=159417 RepID=A0ABP0F8U6_CLALP
MDQSKLSTRSIEQYQSSLTPCPNALQRCSATAWYRTRNINGNIAKPAPATDPTLDDVCRYILTAELRCGRATFLSFVGQRSCLAAPKAICLRKSKPND